MGPWVYIFNLPNPLMFVCWVDKYGWSRSTEIMNDEIYSNDNKQGKWTIYHIGIKASNISVT